MNKKIMIITVMAVAFSSIAFLVNAGDFDNKRYFYLPIISKEAVEESRRVDAVEVQEETAENEEQDSSIPQEILDKTSFDTMDIPFGEELVFRYIYNTVTGQVQYLSIFQNQEVVYANAFLHNVNFIEDNQTIPFARFMDLDINNNGYADFVIESYSGGVHCCYETLFFEYDDQGQLRFRTRINSKHTPLKFSNNDGDDAYEIEVYDYTYDYWFAPFSKSAKPGVTLDFKDGLYRPVIRADETSLNKETAIKQAQILSADKVQWQDYEVAPDLITLIIEDLIYKGHGDWVLDIINAAWPKEDEGRIEWFRTELEEQLKRSPFWSAVAELNGWVDTPNYAPEPTPMPDPEPVIVGPVKEQADEGTPKVAEDVVEEEIITNRTPDKEPKVQHVEHDVPRPDVQTIFVFGKDAEKYNESLKIQADDANNNDKE